MRKSVLTRLGGAALALAAVGLLASCSPEVGSKAWCDKMSAKPKGDWTVNEATDFAKHCVLGNPKP